MMLGGQHSPPPSSATRRKSPRLAARSIAAGPLGTPAEWWSWFASSGIVHEGDRFRELTRAIEVFSMDAYRHDLALLRIWLAYIEAHWSTNQDIDEARRMYKFLKNSHLGLQSADLFLYWAQFELSQGNAEKAVSVLKSGQEYALLRADGRIESAIRCVREGAALIPLEPLASASSPLQADTEPTPTLTRIRRLGPPKRVDAIDVLSPTQPAASGVFSPLAPITADSTVASGAADKEADLKSRSVRVNGRLYKVLQMIGRGGSSRVFRVMDAEGELFALKKVNLRNLDPAILEGYTNEIGLLRDFAGQPHIIRLIDSELVAGRASLYIVMEYGEVDLSRLLREERRDLNFIRYVWQQMLLAVQTVHAAKIVHCDLKPANFLLVKGRLKLIDFGISKAIQSNDTTNVVRENQVGTVNYMSPEALRESASGTTQEGKIKIGRSSDVWSLGCILYEMAVGQPPFAKFSLLQRLQYITDEAYAIEHPHDIDPTLGHVIQSCLARNVRERLTIEELLRHPFLVPPPEAVLVDRGQIRELLHRFQSLHPQLDVAFWTQRIFEQWQRHK